MGNRRAPGIFDDNRFIEGFLEWMVSPDGQVAGEMSDLVFATLDHASVDARRRKIIRADGKRLSIEQSAERIHAEHPDMPGELIETHLCSRLEHCVPESCSEPSSTNSTGSSGRGFLTMSESHGPPESDPEFRTLEM